MINFEGQKVKGQVHTRPKIDLEACSVSNSSPVHVFEQLFSTGQLLDTLQLKARAIVDGSNFNADPHELQVT